MSSSSGTQSEGDDEAGSVSTINQTLTYSHRITGLFEK